MKQLIRHILREHTQEIILEMPKKITQDDWIARASEVHKGKYDYSKVKYKTANDKVKITCPIHGDFIQIANSHLRGQGCPECGKRADTQEQFLQKAKEKHGDKFDYTKTKYKNQNTPIIVTCPIHGDIKTTPANHLHYDCKKCVDEKQRKSPEDFLNQIKDVHGDKYDFSKTKYKGSNEKVIVTCPKHGDFNVAPGHLLYGAGCPKCAREKIGVANSLTQDEFISRSDLVHDNKYDYSKVEYNGINNRVKIICPIHGEFLQTPNTHMSGGGCQECGFESISKSKVGNTETFINSARVVHGEKYDYSLVNYKNNAELVTIMCPKHGEFEQRPGSHLRGSGCPQCQESNGEKLVTSILESNGIDYLKQHKFTDCTNLKKGRFCRKLPFDFYIPNQNTCIEYDGRQHFEPIIGLGGEEAFESQKRRDKIKNQYCKKNGIKLIRITYTMKKEEIEPYILKELGID